MHNAADSGEDKKVTLVKLTRSNLAECLSLKTSGYVATNQESVAQGRKYFFMSKMYLIVANGNTVGFLMLGLFRRLKRVGIWRIMIDESQQNRGYGTAAINSVFQQYRKKHYNTVTLSCDQNNVRAIKLFKRLGFAENGQSVGNEIVYDCPLQEIPFRSFG